MSYTATATSTTTNATSNPMSSPYYQGNPQGAQGQQGQQPSPTGSGQPSPFPSVGFPQQPFNPQQQQFAQWAYQQMMFQQQQLGFQPQVPVAPTPFMTAQQQQALQLQLFQQQQQQQQFLMAQQQQQQFPQPPQLPYAREKNSSKTSVNSERGGSRSRTNSTTASEANKTRTRTTSGKSSKPAPQHHRTPGSESSARSRSVSGKDASPPSPAASQQSHRLRVSSNNSGVTPPITNGGRSSPRPHAVPHSSSATSNGGSSPSSVTSSAAASIKGNRPAGKPSPLSQGTPQTNTAAAGNRPTPATKEAQATSAVPAQRSYAKAVTGDIPTGKSGGLKGRLRRALSFSALDEAAKTEDKEDKLGSRRQVVNAKLATEAQHAGSIPRTSTSHIPSPSDSTLASSPDGHVPTEGSIRSTATTAQQAPKKRSLFNSKFNRSTDNMSMSSTVSSASMMIRKLGSVGKLVRRNSLMGISNMFKDKKDKDRIGSDGEEPAGAKKDKGRKLLKSGKVEASVSHATVELERGSQSLSSPDGSPSSPQDDMVGLSPAAKLARQHTLRSKAAEAAKASATLAKVDEAAGDGTPSTWEKNTATRSTLAPGVHHKRKPVGEFGASGAQPQQTWPDDLSDEETTVDGHPASAASSTPQLGYRDPALVDDDSDEEEQEEEAYDDEDDTVRMSGEVDPMDEPWAVGVRRSVERMRVPVKGILKNAGSYEQSNHLDGPPSAPFTRLRTNSNDSAPPMGAEPGPLARIPSPDPDHIDGLHRSDSGSIRHIANHQRSLSTSSGSSNHGSSILPPLSFDGSDSSSLGSFLISGSTAKERPNSVYSNADFNASAPALGTHNSEQTSLQSDSQRAHAGLPNLTALRSVSTPLVKSKKLTYAANLSVYHTFSPVAYDRRSEPATCNRLTPALAQRIKEELNSYKMEEMEVHPSSRQHTHFFV
ncbi:hypothetical protein FRB94_007163 [Tulasnella sp. JGI-2019a]|nr:hypothetical protein FRB93_012485 [Tulasnella sp. JGI-2019a]KAG9011970.1 hypothetical protein FRB94_007163 [Tulasnella sp. JGI-2019a]KAG9036257.1 hypothetical protein FRB95_009405 [Tulasnella sp. JGI-2019a]